MPELFHSTTVIGLTHNGHTVIGGDGQVTVGNAVMKQGAKKVRKIYDGTVLAGFAGAAADAFTLFERFEDRLQQYHGNLLRAAVELAKAWRTDKYLRH
ncbi:MAG: ATP-dependent protease subunit HslV, partial [Ignavibacteria bacterium]|nr:ATP-dependent protease subunit HslV [Ignavibacteria bacterium]